MNLVINPGSTSTKIAVYDEDKLIAKETLAHSFKDLLQFEQLIDQLGYRKKLIETFLKKENIKLSQIDGFIGRGGLMKSVKSGIYEVNDQMIVDMATCKYGTHASNLGGILAKELADTVHKKAYIADPVVVDEMSSVAKISGLNGIVRRSLWHALNQKAVAKKYCETTSYYFCYRCSHCWCGRGNACYSRWFIHPIWLQTTSIYIYYLDYGYCRWER